MFKRIKQFFESLAYAGLKPSGGKPGGAAGAKPSGLLAPIQERLNKFLNKGGSSDPLYLSNRTFMQKAGIWLTIGVPSVLFYWSAWAWFSAAISIRTRLLVHAAGRPVQCRNRAEDASGLE